MPHGKICYLEIPANRAEDSARFYSDIFGWKVRERGDGNLAFDDVSRNLCRPTTYTNVEGAGDGVRFSIDLSPCRVELSHIDPSGVATHSACGACSAPYPLRHSRHRRG